MHDDVARRCGWRQLLGWALYQFDATHLYFEQSMMNDNP
jgi:hypothetical protein